MIRRRKKKLDPKKQAAVVAEAQRLQAERGVSYRGRALELFPHVCGRCRREFAGADLRELTVHHKDHNHDNNPPDGSNWELLCLYCHDNAHMDTEANGYMSRSTAYSDEEAPSSDDNPFAGLKNLLKSDEDEADNG